MRAVDAVLPLLFATPLAASVPIAQTTSMPTERDTHGSVVVGDRLYVVGGSETRAWKPTASVISAPIEANRLLGEWRDERPLPKRILYIGTSVVTHGDMIYVVGGQQRRDDNAGDNGDKFILNTAHYTTLGADGSLGEWQEGPKWGDDGGLSSAAATNGRALYVSGGGGQADVISDKVFFAPLGADGAPGAWTETSPMPIGLWFHQMAIHGETIFALAGRSSSRADGQNFAIFRSRIQADSALAPWEELNERNPSSTFQGAYASTSNFVFGVGGKDRNWFIVDKITFGTLSPEGISPWQTIPLKDFKVERLAAAASGAHGVLFLTGGRTTVEYSSMTNEVFSVALRKDAEMRPALPPGFDCLMGYEDALGAVRKRGGRLLVITVSGAVPRSAEFAMALCARPVEDFAGMQCAYVNLTTDQALARRLGLLQAGVLAIVDGDEKVLARSSEPYAQELPTAP